MGKQRIPRRRRRTPWLGHGRGRNRRRGRAKIGRAKIGRARVGRARVGRARVGGRGWRGQALDQSLDPLPQCLILLAQHLLALLHLPEVAQLLEKLVEAPIEPRIVA